MKSVISLNSITTISHAGNSKRKTVALFWLILLVVGVSVTLVQFKSIVEKLNRREKQTLIQLQNDDSLNFPAVTVCNLNPYKQSRVNKIPEMMAVTNVENVLCNAQTSPKTDTSSTNVFLANSSATTSVKNSACTPNETEVFQILTGRSDMIPTHPYQVLDVQQNIVIQNNNINYSLTQSWFFKWSPVFKGHFIYNNHTGNVITILQSNNGSLAVLVVDEVNSCAENQILVLEPLYDGCCRIRAKFSNKSLSMNNKTGGAAGSPVGTWDYTQHWYFDQPIGVREQFSLLCEEEALLFQQKVEAMSLEIAETFNLQCGMDPMSQQTTVANSLPYISRTLSDDVRSGLSDQKHEFILYCQFDNNLCDISLNITQWNNINMGNCFTFNDKSGPNSFVTKRVGKANGLTLYLNVDTAEYLKTNDKAGITINIHDPDITVFPDNNRWTVSTETNVDFAISFQILKHLNIPDGSCTDVINDENYFYSRNYTVEGCLRTCYQKFVLETCGCGDPKYPLPKQLPQLGSFCSVEQSSCVENLNSKNAEFDKSCRKVCQKPCTEKMYTPIITWTKFSKNLMNNLANFGPYNASYKINSLVILNVFFPRSGYIVMEETLSYDDLSMWSDFGGIVGNNLDCSFISAFELLALVLLCMLHLANK